MEIAANLAIRDAWMTQRFLCIAQYATRVRKTSNKTNISLENYITQFPQISAILKTYSSISFEGNSLTTVKRRQNA